MNILKYLKDKNKTKNMIISKYCNMPSKLNIQNHVYDIDTDKGIQAVPLDHLITFTLDGKLYSVDSYLQDFAKACFNSGNKEHAAKVIQSMINKGCFVFPSVKQLILGSYNPKVNFDAMEGLEFEHFCGEVLRKNGFENVEVTRGSGDQGIDIIAYKDSVKYGIQCKCYTGNVGNEAVQEAFAGARFFDCHVPVVMTNRYFTKSAKDLAQKNSVILWDRDYLLKLIGGSDIVKLEKEEEHIDIQPLRQLYETSDPYLKKAGYLAIEKGRISIGMVQREFKIGFNRAEHIVKQLEKIGVVTTPSPEEEMKPRRISTTKEDFDRYIKEL